MAQQTYIARKGHDADFADITVDSITIAGTAVDTAVLLASGQAIDLNGETGGIVFDADANSKIYPSADDEITINIGGASDFKIAANTLTALSGSAIATNTITETTSAAGVTIDGVLLKDGGAVFADAATIEVDVVNEATSAAGVTADGVLLKDGGIVCADAATLEVDTINEATSAAGVTIDGALLKDGRSNLGRQVQALTSSTAITIKSGLVTLAHDTVIIAATLAAPVAGDELFIIDASAAGTAAHTVTCGSGVTFDGTNDVATLDAPGEALHIIAISATRWFVLENIGSIAFS